MTQLPAANEGSLFNKILEITSGCGARGFRQTNVFIGAHSALAAFRPLFQHTQQGLLLTRIHSAPQAVEQLGFLDQELSSGSTRRDATRYVAGRLKITIQSVLDKYTRQLSLTASQFDRLLEPGNLGELKSLLKQRFRAHGEVIDTILA